MQNVTVTNFFGNQSLFDYVTQLTGLQFYAPPFHPIYHKHNTDFQHCVFHL